MSRLVRVLLPALAFASACRSVETPYRYPEDMDNPSYVKRAKALGEFAAMHDEKEVGRAFRLLRDEDAGIRNVAWLTLRDLMPEHEDFGYRPYLPDDVRAGIARRWEAWWRKGGAAEGEAAVGALEAAGG